MHVAGCNSSLRMVAVMNTLVESLTIMLETLVLNACGFGNLLNQVPSFTLVLGHVERKKLEEMDEATT